MCIISLLVANNLNDMSFSSLVVQSLLNIPIFTVLLSFEKFAHLHLIHIHEDQKTLLFLMNMYKMVKNKFEYIQGLYTQESISYS